MKKTKLFLCLIAAFMMCVFFVISASAATVAEGTCGENLTWVLDDSGTLEISGEGAMDELSSNTQPWKAYREQIKNVNIANGVTTVGDYAFSSCTALEKISIPATLTVLDSGCFSRCTALTEVLFEDGSRLETIGGDAFANCTSLQKISIPSVYELCGLAFYGCSSLAEITLVDLPLHIYSKVFAGTAYFNNEENWENGVLYIGSHLIAAKTDIQGEYTVKDGTKSISDDAFIDCVYMTSIVLADSVVYVGGYTFRDCTSLKTVMLSKNLLNIQATSFDGCTVLDAIYINPENKHYSSADGVLYQYNQTVLVRYPLAKKDEVFVIPQGVQRMRAGAFDGALYLKEIIVPNGMREINQSGMYDCNLLEHIILPVSISKIGSYAFHFCEELTEIVIVNKNCEIYDNAYTIPSSAVIIGYEGSTAQSYAQKYNRSFVAITADGTCGENLIWILDKNGTLEISGKGAMDDFTTGTQPWYAYINQIKSINVGYGVAAIGKYSFSSLINVKTVSLPETLEEIKYKAFSICKFTEIQLPDSLKIIEEYAFSSCDQLATITIPPLVQSIYAMTFFGNNSLNSINAHPDNEFFCSENGVLYTKDKSTLLIYPRGKTDTSFNVPDQVEIIGEYAFAYNKYLQSVKLSDSVTLLEENAFFDSNYIEKVEFGKNVAEIGECAFYGCEKLSEIDLSENLISIGSGAFCDCRSISQIELPDTLQYIGNTAFWWCTSISSITIPASVKSIAFNAFQETTALTEIIVDENNENYCSEDGVLYSKDMYSLKCYPAGRTDAEFSVPDNVVIIDAKAFSYNSHIKEINFSRNSAIKIISGEAFSFCTALSRFTVPKNCEDIFGNTFEGCSALEGIYVDFYNQYFSSFGGVLFDKAEETLIVYPAGMETETYIIPANVKVIANSSFSNCKNLKTVLFEIGSALVEIEQYAFEDCTALEYIALPDSLEKIESSAFWECDSLSFIYIPENVTSIENYVFYSCSSLEKIVFLTKECAIGPLMTSSTPAVFYVYKDSPVDSALSAQGECRYLLEGYDDVYSFSDGVLMMNDIEALPDTEDSFLYPWARYSKETAGIVLNNVGSIGENVFGDFTECTAVIVMNDTAQTPVTTTLSANSFVGCNSLKTLVSVSDIYVEENAFVGNEQPVSVFAKDTVNCETYTDCVTFTFNDGVVSFPEAQLSLNEYDFFDIVTAVCYALTDETVNMFEFADIETVGFAFNSYFENEENNPVRVSYENIKVIPLQTYDGESFEQISFNEFCEIAASDEYAFLMLKLYEEADEEEPAPDDDNSVFVSFSEFGEYILRTIVTLLNKLLNLFKRK